MADIASRDPAKPPILNDLLCPMCKNVFNRPKQLSYCGHVLCADCLAKTVKPVNIPGKPSAMTATCPVCNIVSHLSNGLQGVRTNLPLFNITESVRAYEKWYMAEGIKQDYSRKTTSFLSIVKCCASSTSVKGKVCSHCSVEFCPDCESAHFMDLKDEASRLASTLISKLPSIAGAVSSLGSKIELLQPTFRRGVERLRNQVSEAVSSISASLQEMIDTEEDSVISEVQASSINKIDSFSKLLEKWKNCDLQRQTVSAILDSLGTCEAGDAPEFLNKLKELEDEVVFVMSFADDLVPEWEFSQDADSVRMVDDFVGNFRLGSAAFKWVTPSLSSPFQSMNMSPTAEPPPSDFSYVVDGKNSRPVSRISIPRLQLLSVPPNLNLPTPTPTPTVQYSFNHLMPYDKSLYDFLVPLGAISKENFKGTCTFAKPTGCCVVSPPQYPPVAAVIHNSKFISLISAFGLESTIEVVKPLCESDCVYLGWEIAAESSGNLFVTCHKRTRILQISIPRALQQKGVIIPDVFCRTTEEGDKFNGLAVCDDRGELYSALSEGVAGFSLEDGTRKLFVRYPVLSMKRGCCMLSVVNQGSKCTVVFSSMHRRQLHSFVLPNDVVKNEQDDLKPCIEDYLSRDIMDESYRVLTLDPVGNVIIQDTKTGHFQVNSYPAVLMSYLPTMGSLGSDLTSCSVLPPYESSSPALIVANYSSNTILTFGLSTNQSA